MSAPTTRPVTLLTEDGLRLEGRWDLPDIPERVAVFCHPHPLHGGTMNAPLMVKVTDVLVGEGYAVLRFNFRGVGGSEGTWADGEGEVHDVAAAVAEASTTFPSLPLGLAGWSFGAATALRWQARAADDHPYAGIAPPVDRPQVPPLPRPEELRPAPRTFIIGDRDQFTTVEQLAAYARSIGARLEVLAGSDHFFYFREAKVGRIVADALRAADGDLDGPTVP